MKKYALILGHIVTANADGSVPADADTVCKVSLPEVYMDSTLLLELLEQANRD